MRLADQEPISYCTAYINRAYVPVLQTDMLETSLIAMFTEKPGVAIHYRESFVTATLAGEEIACQPKIRASTPILGLEHVGFLATGEPVFFDITDSVGERYVMQVPQGVYYWRSFSKTIKTGRAAFAA